MTEVPMTPPGVTPEPGGQPARAPARPIIRRALLVTAALLLPLIGIAALFAFVFQPFADAAGGCGGG